MKKIFLLLSCALCLSACVSLSSSTDYIPMGPDGLSIGVKDISDLPVFTYLKDIEEPWAPIGMYRVKNLPNDDAVIKSELVKLKKAAIAKGADAIILNQFFDDAAAQDGRPITIAAYFVKYARTVTEEDKIKIKEYSELEKMRNANN